MNFVRRGMGYVATWPEGAVEMRVERLRRKSGELVGELAVEAATSRGHLHRANANLSSTSARKTLANILTERSRPQEYDWFDKLEQFSMAVLDAERQGTPLVRVGHLPPSPQEKFRVDPLIPERRTTIVYGPGGTGKSYFAIAVAIAVATGRPFLGWPVRQGNVVYLDWEADYYEVDERIKRVSAGLGITPPDNIAYKGMALPLVESVEDVGRDLDIENAGLVIVDSVEMASGAGGESGDANDRTLRLFTALRSLGRTFLALDHVRGDELEPGKAAWKPYGSVFKGNLARATYELRASAEAGELALYNRKVNNSQRWPDPVGITVSHTGDAVTFTRHEIEAGDLLGGMTISKRIERVLRDGPLAADEIAEAINAELASVNSKLSTYRNRMWVKLPDKRWGLMAYGEREAA